MGGGGWVVCSDHQVSPVKWLAPQYCWDNGGYLAEFFSAEEEGLLDQIIYDGGQYWLGLSDTAQEGQSVSQSFILSQMVLDVKKSISSGEKESGM